MWKRRFRMKELDIVGGKKRERKKRKWRQKERLCKLLAIVCTRGMPFLFLQVQNYFLNQVKWRKKFIWTVFSRSNIAFNRRGKNGGRYAKLFIILRELNNFAWCRNFFCISHSGNVVAYLWWSWNLEDIFLFFLSERWWKLEKSIVWKVGKNCVLLQYTSDW